MARPKTRENSSSLTGGSLVGAFVSASSVSSFPAPASCIRWTLRELQEGRTVPFLARYRKDETGGLEAEAMRTLLLYIVDAENHRIRYLTATCSKVCENGGQCSSPETCSCPAGWGGDDCTAPQCDTACGTNRVCAGTAHNAKPQCVCRPGWGGAACTQALCVQGDCGPNAACTAPDTCTCNSGWFDANCTTPVCGQTCGNGGNCTSPNTCTCPTEWRGHDCRTPACTQECKNGGLCVAPDTCV
eukprot:g5608.t1